jgi:hypothetical protein
VLLARTSVATAELRELRPYRDLVLRNISNESLSRIMRKIEEINFDEVIAPILQDNTSYLVVLLSLFAALKTARRQFGIPETHRLCVLTLSVFDNKI